MPSETYSNYILSNINPHKTEGQEYGTQQPWLSHNIATTKSIQLLEKNCHPPSKGTKQWHYVPPYPHSNCLLPDCSCSPIYPLFLSAIVCST